MPRPDGIDRRQLDMEKLDERLRAVEGALVEQTTELRLWREQSTRDDYRRKETCPHSEDFIVIMESLKAGGKRFQQLESVQRDATIEHMELGRRIDSVEDRMNNERSWRKGARWGLVGLGGGVVYAIDKVWPLLVKLLTD